MQASTLMLSGRFTISALLIAVGLLAIFFGYRLFVSGVGLKADRGKIKLRAGKASINYSVSNVGSTLMLTSIAWGLFSYLSLPRYSESPQSLQIGNFDSAVKTVSFDSMNNLDSADRLAIEQFAIAYKKVNATHPGAIVYLATPPNIPAERKIVWKNQISMELERLGVDAMSIQKDSKVDDAFSLAWGMFNDGKIKGSGNAAMIIHSHSLKAGR